MKVLTLQGIGWDPPITALPAGYARRIPLDLALPCRPWLGTIRDHGYGEVMIDGTPKYPHRMAYQLHVGPIPRGWELDHVCHSLAVHLGECEGGVSCLHRRCWEPAHLEAVTSWTNSMRGNHPLFSVARGKECSKGHDLSDPANVYVNPNTGKRRCRTCQLIGQGRRRAASKS